MTATKKRPKEYNGKTQKYKTGCGALYVTLNRDEEGTLREVVLVLGKCGSCKNTDFYILGVLLSVLLQSDISDAKIKKTIKKHFVDSSCENPFSYDENPKATCYDVIGRSIIKALEEK